MRRTAPALKPNCRLLSRRSPLRPLHSLTPQHHLIVIAAHDHLERLDVSPPHRRFAPLLPLDPSQLARRRLANRPASGRLHGDSHTLHRPRPQVVQRRCGSGIPRAYSLRDQVGFLALHILSHIVDVRRRCCTTGWPHYSPDQPAGALDPHPLPCPRHPHHSYQALAWGGPCRCASDLGPTLAFMRQHSHSPLNTDQRRPAATFGRNFDCEQLVFRCCRDKFNFVFTISIF